MFNQRTTILIQLIQNGLNWCYLCYLFSAIILAFNNLYVQLVGREGIRKTALGRWVNRIWYWCKWPALAFLILDPFFCLVIGQKMGWLYWLLEALGFYNWYTYKDEGDDDDEFKKKFKKAAKKIIQSKGKLIVVPESA